MLKILICPILPFISLEELWNKKAISWSSSFIHSIKLLNLVYLFPGMANMDRFFLKSTLQVESRLCFKKICYVKIQTFAAWGLWGEWLYHKGILYYSISWRFSQESSLSVGKLKKVLRLDFQEHVFCIRYSCTL